MRHVQIAALREEQIAATERLQMPRLLARHLADALRHGTHLTALTRQDRQDAVGLAEVVAAQHDPFRAIGSLSGSTGHADTPFASTIIADGDGRNQKPDAGNQMPDARREKAEGKG